ncbi:putative sugar O-acetyltransferase [Stachybotrys elegans]|uniref:Sugar O-acetyltransferase n=1 Tax=Stachybotrys elegans TaxID=80388 RepID=A0A8K0WL97_9HYPO|nr:putative sugar O-acetyltransferase [Stachybotrys elegans]
MVASTEKDPAIIAHAKTLENTPWCDDYEKMISGVLYNCLAPELVNGRFRARRLMTKYNTHFPDDATPESLLADREAMLRQMLGKLGKDSYMEPPLNIDYGCNISIGDSFYSNFNLVILDCGMVTIGNRVMFGPFVSIFAATHETGVESRRAGVEYARGVTIGDDCWIGGNTTIMPGVNIGSPAKVVKKVDPVPDL